MNEKLIELAKAAGFTWNTSYREFSENGFVNEKLAKFAELVREDERKSKWLPIESAPKDEAILGLFDSGNCTTLKIESDGEVIMPDEYLRDILTHWQPLPDSPQETAEPFDEEFL